MTTYKNRFVETRKHQPTEVKLQWLRRRANFKIEANLAKQEYSKHRKRKHSATGPCYVCGNKADYQHHLIMLKNGGRDCPRNRINICHQCHCEIHNWMMPNTPKEISEMDKAFSETIR